MRDQGLNDGETCDVVAAAAARCFFSTYFDGLGFEPDTAHDGIPDGLRAALTIARPIDAGWTGRLRRRSRAARRAAA